MISIFFTLTHAWFRLDEHVIVDGKVVVIYLDTHVDSISWFWRIVAAGAIPCILSTLPKDNEQKKKKLLSITTLQTRLFARTNFLLSRLTATS